MLPLPSLRQLCGDSRPSLCLAQQLCWETQLSLLLLIRPIWYHSRELVGLRMLGTMLGIHEPAPCFVSPFYQRQQSSLRHVHLWPSGNALPCGPLWLPFVSYGPRRNHQRVSKFSQICKGGSTQAIHAGQLLEKLDCCTRKAKAAHISSFQENV